MEPENDYPPTIRPEDWKPRTYRHRLEPHEYTQASVDAANQARDPFFNATQEYIERRQTAWERHRLAAWKNIRRKPPLSAGSLAYRLEFRVVQ